MAAYASGSCLFSHSTLVAVKLGTCQGATQRREDKGRVDAWQLRVMV